jgi:hypothetical protein
MYGGNRAVALVAGDHKQTYEVFLRALAGVAPLDPASILASTAARYYLGLLLTCQRPKRVSPLVAR